MNYLKIYDKIIINCQNRYLDESIYCEKHHVLPKCLGGDDTTDNIVKVTAKEHFVLHHLLAVGYQRLAEADANYTIRAMKLSAAFNRMCTHNSGKRKINARLFKRARELFSKNHPMKSDYIKAVVSEKLKIRGNHNKMQRLMTMPLCGNDCGKRVKTKYAIMCSRECFSQSRRGCLQSEESNLKRSKKIKEYISSLGVGEKQQRLNKSLHSACVDHAIRSANISNSKKGKATRQQAIMKDRIKCMSDQEFENYINSKSPKIRTRIFNLRNK
jgi:hypothetical protein